MLAANNRIIYTTDCYIQFNCTHFCVHMIFLLMLKICMDKNFLLIFSLTFLFSKISLIFLNFPDALKNSQTSLTEWKPCPCWWKFQRSKSKTRRNSTSFSWTPWKFPSLSSVWIFSGIAHSPSLWASLILNKNKQKKSEKKKEKKTE